jgi:hypothetical protein
MTPPFRLVGFGVNRYAPSRAVFPRPIRRNPRNIPQKSIYFSLGH